MFKLLTGRALAEQIIAEIRTLRVTAGALRGEPFEVLEWQKEFIYGMCGASISLLTVARGNGKTTLIAAIGTTAIVPERALHRPRGKTLIVASSMDQAKEAFDHILYFIADTIDEDRHVAVRSGEKNPWRISDNVQEGRIRHVPTGAEVRIIGSLPKKAHGKAPGLMILDEPAQWEGPGGGRKMYNAMKTSRGKEEDARLLILGTRPESEQHWYAELLADPKSAFLMSFAADRNDDDFSEETIKKANPSYDHMPALRKVIAEESGEAADGGPELLLFRAHRLNKGTPEIQANEMLVELENWQAIETLNPKPRAGPLFIGFDLGGGVSMTAIAFYWPETGRLEAYGAFPAEPNLLEHGKNDGVGDRYARMYERGELKIYPGVSTNNPVFLSDMMARVRGEQVESIAADNFKKLELKQALLAAGLGNHYELALRRVGKGHDGSEDVRAFQAEVLEAHMSVEPSELLRTGISEAVLTRDSNGNAALNKARRKGRIDAIQAAILAVGMGRRWRVPSEEAPDFDVNRYVLTEMYR